MSGNLGLIALFAGVALVFGGIVAANQAGLFSGGHSGEVTPCEETFIGQTVHEHAQLEVYLDSDQPYDFSPERYQLADNRIHFEHGQGDANGATIHIHEARPTLGCMFQTLGWTVGEDYVETDQGEVYEGEVEITVNGEPADRGFNEPLEGTSSCPNCPTYVVSVTPGGSGGNATDGGNGTSS